MPAYLSPGVYVEEVPSGSAPIAGVSTSVAGFRDAISSIVLSLSSTPESFGRTLAEAPSIGTPVVGYNHGGVAEILAAQYPSGAVEPGNLDALTESVASILARKPPPVPGPNAFEKATMLLKTLDVYEMVCGRAR